MKKKIVYTDEPLGQVQVVADFLSPPEQFVFKTEPSKVTGHQRAKRGKAMNDNLRVLLQNFLNQCSTIRQMQEVSDKGKPAVEALDSPLLTRPEFGEFHGELREYRTRREIGRMVRQVLERHGYEWVCPRVKVEGKLFTRGSVYRRVSDA